MRGFAPAAVARPNSSLFGPLGPHQGGKRLGGNGAAAVMPLVTVAAALAQKGQLLHRLDPLGKRQSDAPAGAVIGVPGKAERCRSTLRMRPSSQPAMALVMSTYSQLFQV